MADRIRGITVELNGDTSGLSKSLKSVNSEIKSTESQLKDVEKLLKLDPKNVELLRQKQKLTNDAIAEGKQKLDSLRQAEQKLKDSGVDENSKQFMALRREIIATESSIQSYGDSAKEVSDATEKSTGSAKIGWLAVATAIIAASKALSDMTVGTAAAADEILTLSSITGMSTDKIQEMKYAAELVDVSFETLSTAMKRNIRSMASAKDGTEASVEAYAALGIAVTEADGSLRDSQTVFNEAITALGTIGNETERDALAMELFGKSATDLNPLIEAGSDRLAELAAQAHEVGYVLNDESLAAFGSFDDSIQILKNDATAAKNAVAEVMLPALQEGVNVAGTVLEKFTEIVKNSQGDIGEVLVGIIDVVVDMLPKIVDRIIELCFKITDAIIDALPDLIPKIVDAILEIINKLRSPQFIVKLIASVGELIWNVLKGVFNSIPSLLSFFGGSANAGSSLNMFATGGVLSNGGAAIVGEAGPELLTNVGGKSIVTPLTNPANTSTGATEFNSVNTINISFNGSLAQLAQVLQPYITAETHRTGA